MHRNARLDSLASPTEPSSAERAMIRMATTGTVIRDCTKEDLARIAEIHKAQFVVPGALLGQLSPALISALYGEFLDRSIFLVHTSDGEIDGFVLGGSTRVMTWCKLSFLRKHVLVCMAEIVARPRLWLMASYRFVKLIGRWVGSLFAVPPPHEYRMLSIAVAVSATRKGVGTALVRGFESRIRAECRTY